MEYEYGDSDNESLYGYDSSNNVKFIMKSSRNGEFDIGSNIYTLSNTDTNTNTSRSVNDLNRLLLSYESLESYETSGDFRNINYLDNKWTFSTVNATNTCNLNNFEAIVLIIHSMLSSGGMFALPFVVSWTSWIGLFLIAFIRCVGTVTIYFFKYFNYNIILFIYTHVCACSYVSIFSL